jgi:carboxyl-terminal processing protease
MAITSMVLDKVSSCRSVLVLCLLAMLSTSPVALAQLESPSFRDRMVSRRVSFYLENLHIRGARLDDAASHKIFDSYVGTLDPMRFYFLESDITEFKEHINELDDKLLEGDLDFAHLVFHRYLERLEEAVARLDSLLEEEIDFEVEDFIETDRENSKFAKNDQEMDVLWRKRVKLLILERLANDEEPDKARELVAKLHHDFLKRMKQTNNTELLQMYLTAATTTYDPHTTYLSPDTLENFQISMRLQLEGIGAALTTDDGYVVVSEVIAGGAASRDGRLQARDKIHAVAQGKDGEFTELFNVRLTEVVKQIRGKRGTIVRLRIEHEGTGGKEIIEIERAKVVLQDRQAQSRVFEVEADGSTVGNGKALKVGVIDLPSFYMDLNASKTGKKNFKSTTKDVEKILKQFRKDKVAAVVVDLRFNGGGSLREAIDMTGLFIDKGPVVQIKRPGGETDVQNDKRAGMAWDGPLVVLTSKLSASASEIFAGAIQDYGRGLLVGDSTTHGKGTVQELISLDRGASAIKLGAIKITISQFYRPSGDSTQNLGVVPHVELPSMRSHLDIGEADLDFALEFDRVRPSKFTKVGAVNKRLIGHVTALSNERTTDNVDFQRVEKEIARYLKVKGRKFTPLSKDKFFEDYKRKQTKEKEPKVLDGKKVEGDPQKKSGLPKKTDEASKTAPKESIIRDFYLDEVLAITRDFVAALDS